MEDPIKIIHKIKNNNKKIIYKMYIFIGLQLPKYIYEILELIKYLDFYNTLITIDKKKLNQLELYYGEKWYEKFYLSYHIESQRYIINNSEEKKLFLINKFSNDWYNNNILPNNIIIKYNKYSYADNYYNNMISYKKIKNQKIKTTNYRTYQPEQILQKIFDTFKQKGGDDTDGDPDGDHDLEGEIEGDLEGEIDEVDNNVKINVNEDINEIDISLLEKIYLDKDNQTSINLKAQNKLLNKVLDDENWNNKIENLGLVYDEDDENNIYDMLLQDVYKKYYIIDQYIFKDETIQNIKNKIALSLNLSKKFNNLKIIPETQYLWSEYKIMNKNKYFIDQIMIGQKWIKRNELINIDIIPNENIIVYEKSKNNLKNLKNSIEYKLKRDDDDNNILSYYEDYITNNEIFLLDIYNELGLGYNPIGENKINIYEIYINIYFYYITFDHFNQIIDFLNNTENTKEIRYNESIIEPIIHDMKLETEIENTVEELKILMKNNLFDLYFYDNHIIHSNIHLNINNYKNITGTLSNTKYNLYRIFDNFIVNEKYPFIHIQTLKTEASRKFYTKFNNKELLTKWFETSPNGLAIKILLNPNKYLTILFHETGKIEYTTIWKEEEEATIKDIQYTFDFVKKLIEKINNENTKINIVIPTDEQFNYGFINSIQKFSLPNDLIINHDDLSDLARYFYNYVSLVIEPKKRESLKNNNQTEILSKYGTYLRYKRVNKYDNKIKRYMKILYYIKNYEINNNDIINILSKSFNLTKEDATKEVNYVKHKYSKLIIHRKKKLKNIKLLPKIKSSGVGIDIQGRNKDNYKIRITGAKNKIQLENILDFIKILIYLYTNIYLYKNKEYIKIKELLKGLHKIAKRLNKVSNYAVYEDSKKEIKLISKLDKDRLGYTPDKGKNQYSRLCQNSGKKKRRPAVIPEEHINKLIEEGYKFNNKTNFYEKEITIKIKNKFYKTIIKAIKLSGSNSTYNYYTCDPSQNNQYVHIGFLTKGNNPNELCMPCCYKKDFLISPNTEKRNYYLKCINENNKNNETDQNNLLLVNLNEKIYILNKTDKIENNKFIFLPKYLDILFNHLWNNSYIIKNHYLHETITGYFFKYTIKNDKQLFLSIISNIFILSINEIINKCIDFLENKKNYNYFVYLNNGDIALNFNNNIDDYIKFIKITEQLDYDQIGELIGLPGVISPKGINYFIFYKNKIIYNTNKKLEKENFKEEFYLKCLNKENYNNYYQDRDFICLIKEDKFYSPIYKIYKTNKKILLDQKYNLTEKAIGEIQKYYNQNCNTDILNNLFFEKKLFVKNITNLLNIKMQYIDKNNKCTFLELDNNLVIPVYPSGIIYNYPHLNINKIKYLDFKTTIKLLDKINKDLLYIPKTVLYDKIIDNSIQIYSILLENNLIIPIISELVKDTNIKKMGLITVFEQSEYKINNAITNNIKHINDQRSKNIKEFNYNKEGYNLFRLELSYYFSKNEEVKKNVINLVRTNNILNKKEKLFNLLFNIIYKKIGIINNKSLDLSNYNINNLRKICINNIDQNSCNNNFHCIWHNETCKFQVNENMLIIYINKVIEEFIQDNIHFKEIIEENEYYVLDIVNNLHFIPRENQKIYTTTNLNIKKILNELFDNKIQFSKKDNIIDYEVHPLVEFKDQYTQEIIPNNNSIIRAYINCYYWINNPIYSIENRNLGYFSEFQTQLSYLLKAHIIEYMEEKLKIDYIEIKKFRKSILNSNCKLELLILSNLINNPIIVLNNKSIIINLYLQGEIPVNKNTIEKFNNLKNAIIIKLDFDNNKNIPNKIYSIYKI